MDKRYCGGGPADLNLLIVFTVLAEERNGTRAAARVLLSQPAMGRVLQRPRQMFHDDLLFRSSSGCAPTPRGSASCTNSKRPCRVWIVCSAIATLSQRGNKHRSEFPEIDHACYAVRPLLSGGLCLHPESEPLSLFSSCRMGSLQHLEQWRRADSIWC